MCAGYFFIFICCLYAIAHAFDFSPPSYGQTNPGMHYGTGGDTIPIGLISDDNAEDLGKIFDYAIMIANEDLGIKLYGTQEIINYGDSLQGYSRLCKLMQDGTGAIFGPSAKQTASHLMNVCDTKDIPYIYAHMREKVDSFNLHPHPMDVAKVLYTIINEFEWKHFIFLYECSEYLSILNGLMSMYGENGPVITVLRYDLQLNGNYKAVLRRVRKHTESQIVIAGSTKSVAEVLKQAQQVGIMNEDYNYIISNLDLHTYDLEEYRYSEANITGFRMFSTEEPLLQKVILELYPDFKIEDFYEDGDKVGFCPITMEMALVYDAIQMIAETSKHLPYHPQSLNCSELNELVQPDGSTFKNYMRSLDINENTLTGRIFFEGDVRKGYKFDVIEMQSKGLVKVGVWEEHKNFTFNRPPEVKPIADVMDNSLVNKTFKVLISVPNKPYASLVESHKRLNGNSQYQGYGIEVINHLAEKLGFNYTFINGGNDYGFFNKTTNLTTGMLKEIVEGRADLAITDLTITSEREEAIDFSIPFMNLGISILYVKPRKADPALFSFMDPFSKEVWLYVGLAYLGVSLSFFILGRLSPTEWDNPYPCNEEPEELENQFTVNNSFWFTTGAVLQQGSEIAPKALSTRTLASIWWFFTLIMVSSYTANLAAFLTIENPVSLINSVQDLADNKGGVEYGAKRTGSTRNFFLSSEEETYKKMNEYMTNHKDLLTETNLDGVNRVSAKYAFLMESTSIEYHIVRQCDLIKIGEPLDEKGYGIAMVKNWPYRDKFNNALLELQEQGVLARIKNKWWREVGAGVCEKSSDGAGDVPALTWANLGGVFFVLGVGSFFSVIYGIFLWCLNVIKKVRDFDVRFGPALLEECKTVVDFANNERILKSATSVYSHSRNSLNSIDSIKTDGSEEDDNVEDSIDS